MSKEASDVLNQLPTEYNAGSGNIKLPFKDKLLFGGFAGLIGLTGATLAGLVAIVIVENIKSEKLDHTAPAAAADDGFPGSERMYAGALRLNLGSCAVTDVNFDYRDLPDNRIDITSYQFSILSNAPTDSSDSSTGLMPNGEVSEVSFAFTNMSDLKKLLGDEPCITLALSSSK
jgi:hypothetical protein